MDMLRLKEHALLAVLLLLSCALASSGAAQPTPPGESYDYMAGGSRSQQPPQQDVQVSTTMIALLAGAVAVFVFIALSIIYLRHCTGYYDSVADRSTLPGAVDASTFISRRLQHRQQQRGTATTTRGLDKEVVEAFPTMRYAEAKALRVGKTQGLECAVCLSEFEDEERLRLLPRCSHAFHPDCIGAWLASHVTCPVCRRNLDPAKDPGSDDEPSLLLPPPTAPALAAAEANLSHSSSSEIAAVVVGRQNDGDVAIDVAAELEEEEEAERRRKEALELQRIGTQQRRAMRSRSSKKARLVRSHSTGHDSLAAAGRDDMERFTLRLPEHVRREMMAAASSWDQLSSTRRGQKSGGGVSASSSRGAARWPSFFACTRTWSGRLPVFLPMRRTAEQSSDGGEVSSTSSSRIRGKRVAAVDVVDGGAFAVGAADPIAAAGGGGKVGSVAVDVDSKATSRQVRT